jgi:hypothetical protein
MLVRLINEPVTMTVCNCCDFLLVLAVGPVGDVAACCAFAVKLVSPNAATALTASARATALLTR